MLGLYPVSTNNLQQINKEYVLLLPQIGIDSLRTRPLVLAISQYLE